MSSKPDVPGEGPDKALTLSNALIVNGLTSGNFYYIEYNNHLCFSICFFWYHSHILNPL